MFGDIGTLVVIHTTLSFIALALGFGAVAALMGRSRFAAWLPLFLAAALATTLTGFCFPFLNVTPAFVTGIVATVSLVAVYIARDVYHLTGRARFVYAAGTVFNFYLLAFVAVAQAFLKIDFLFRLAPTQSEWPFAAAQLLTLAIFIGLGIKTVKKFTRHDFAPAAI